MQSSRIVLLCAVVLVVVVSVTEGQIGSTGCSRKWAPAGWCWRYCSGSSGSWCYTGNQGPCETASCTGGSCSGISCEGADDSLIKFINATFIHHVSIVYTLRLFLFEFHGSKKFYHPIVTDR
ncbi:hypothetical protein Fcan01_19002 [Folsomia candida]|uniref:Uncharacterized protein n=1 Tax=Folsomia candida TaxID=158441 RepID=A0A226DP95_FOLCA|nr:hypothetical protein Fcan01_19002 [Folsomia candida]